MNYKILKSAEELTEILKHWSGHIALDTETYGEFYKGAPSKLLGISLAPEYTNSTIEAVYIPAWIFERDTQTWTAFQDLSSYCIPKCDLVGHNAVYDKRVMSILCGRETSWKADTMLMWHMADPEQRRYGLKTAQIKLLGWADKGDIELEQNVKMHGGKLSNGDHYLADLEILAKYACLDALSTIQVFKKLSNFFDRNAYWPFLGRWMAYHELLDENAYLGLPVDQPGLLMADKHIREEKEVSLKAFFKAVSSEINDLEEDWKERQAVKYKRSYNKEHFLATPSKWKKFNLNSDLDKRELFFGKLGFPVIDKTEKGFPSTGADSIKFNKHPAMEHYLKYEKANTLSSNFTRPYLDTIFNSRIHPRFNICGTVSYRLSGSKPYLLNAPFGEKEIMCNLQIDKGYIGVHTDLASIEPCITAHYSEDPSLLKVYRNGLGDIYLDLALTLFPDNKELHDGYNPNIMPSKAIKDRFSRERKIAKVIQLAVQYTGTGHTVSKNLTKSGLPTTVEQANNYVRAFWRKFSKVKEFNQKLAEVYKKKGHLRNVVGRIISVPNAEYKDLPNRFIQSSAHDILVMWVGKIYENARSKGIDIKPVLLDCHDSTSNMCRIGQEEALKQIYQDSLEELNRELELSVTIRCETKLFHTLAGLKGDEE